MYVYMYMYMYVYVYIYIYVYCIQTIGNDWGRLEARVRPVAAAAQDGHPGLEKTYKTILTYNYKHIKQ